MLISAKHNRACLIDIKIEDPRWPQLGWDGLTEHAGWDGWDGCTKPFHVYAEHAISRSRSDIARAHRAYGFAWGPVCATLPWIWGLVLAHFSFQGFRLNMSMTQIFWGLYSKQESGFSLPIHQRTSHVSGSQHNVQYAPVALRSAEKVASFAPDLQLIDYHHVGTSWMVHQFSFS